jgi:hypothetical protein
MLIFSNLAPRIRQKLRNAGIQEQHGVIQFVNSLNDASQRSSRSTHRRCESDATSNPLPASEHKKARRAPG